MVDAGLEAVPCKPRIVVLAPFGRDSVVLCDVLARAGLEPLTCSERAEIKGLVHDDTYALILTQEALAPGFMADLLTTLSAQPPWSDLPVLLLAGSQPFEPESARAIASLRAVANPTVLERPVRTLTLITTVQAAMQARRRQYEIRDLVQRERTARAEADAASQLKDEFVATISHELRTPLGSILLWTRLFNRGQLDEAKLHRALQSIGRSAEAQSKLIEDLLDVSRMTLGKLRLNRRETDLAQITHAALDIVRPAAEAKRITIEASIEPQAGLVLADPDRIQQVLWNLLSNAVKFTPPDGRVSIELQHHHDRLRIEVADTGMGISPKFLPHVFDRFRQEDATPQRGQSGLGIGLSICRQLVELHGGTIRAASPGEGQGAVFTVELPLATRPTAKAAEPAPRVEPGKTAVAPGSFLSGVRVLLVEDDVGTKDAMTLLLQLQGAEVTATSSAETALALLSTTGKLAKGGPHVLVSDLGMPGMDGFELLRRIRAMEAQRAAPALPAVLISAYARPEDRATALAAGFAAHVLKPFEPEQLIAAVERLAPRNR